jgi:hypothetical protein
MATDSTNQPSLAGDLARMFDWWKAFIPAPRSLVQPILPGWTWSGVTINSGNSSAPDVEMEVVQHHSYGRQLGRVADALEALIEERSDSAGADERLTEFTTMKQEIDEVKLDATEARVRQLETDLATLKHARPEEYQRLRDGVRAVLDT